MKRRALLLGVLLAPTAARAKSTRQTAATRQPAKKIVPPKPAAAAPKPAVVSAPTTQLVAFNDSPFPYRGIDPTTNKPFLDVQSGRRRGHTSLNGSVYWEDQTYSDRRSLLYLPAGFDPQKPLMIMLFLHGQGATLERDVVGRQGVPRQIAESGQNVALVAPQLAVDAADSSAGNYWKPGHFANYIDEAAERLMRLYGDRNAGRGLNLAPVVIVAYSGGYLSAAYALDCGGAAHRVKGVILLDALFGDEDKFAGWAATYRRQSFLFSAYSDATRDENANLQTLFDKRRIPYSKAPPATLNPGTMAFAYSGGGNLHDDFVTRAWRPDPVKAALAMIPGYGLGRGKQGA